MKRTFSFILIILIFLSSVALGTSQQSANKEKQRVCGSETNYPVGHPMHKYFQEKQKDIERRIDDYLSKQKVKDLKNYNAEVNNGIITIPVVFHIFHYGTPIGVDENISALHILAQVSQLNDDFRRTNSDASNTVPAFASVAADTEIEFCVASYDPFGFPTNGVVRHNINNFVSTSPGECITDNTVDGSIKPFTIWDSAKFLNVWVIPDICGLYGFAQFPEESENTDGVALISSCIGALNYPSALPGERSHGRILTHEVGHFLNLYHTFSGGCSNLDFVDDTPAISESSSACNLTQVFMWELRYGSNYMDYTDDLCKNLFTQGQKARMNAALNLFRPGLIEYPCNTPLLTNDLCQDAKVVEPCSSYFGTTIGATTIGGSLNCNGGTTQSPGSWFKFVADGSVYAASTCGDPTFDTVIDIYSGTCGSLTCVSAVESNPNCIANADEIAFSTIAGQTYYIYVRGNTISSFGFFDLTLYKNPLVSSSADDGPGSLREAIRCASNGAIINFDQSMDNVPIYLDTAIVVERDISIVGNSYASAVIDGSLMNSSLFRFNGGQITLKNMKLSNGGNADAYINGGALSSTGNTNAINCIFENNQVNSDGGAIFVANAEKLNIVNCQFRNNKSNLFASAGGAVACRVDTLNIVNSLFADNYSEFRGGAIHIYFPQEPQITIRNNTIANNTANFEGGGIYSNNEITEFYNNIVYGNISDTGADLFSNGIAQSSNNIVQDTSGSGIITGFSLVDPLFINANAQNYGLQANSPGIDAGNTGLLPIDIFDVDLDGNFSESMPIDIYGSSRLVGQSIDIGAIENIPEACSSAEPIACNQTIPVNLNNAYTRFNCGPTFTSVVYAFTFSYENEVIITLSNFTGDKSMFLYNDLCGSTCNILDGSITNSNIESISYTLLPYVTYYLEVFDSSGNGGQADLNLSCSPDPCLSDLSLVSPEDDVTNGIQDFITNENIIASNVISETGDSYFICGPNNDDYILLEPGFTVKLGGKFQTFNTGCVG